MNAAREQRIVREVDAGDDVRDAERDLLGLGEEVVGIAVQDEPADGNDRNQLFGNDLRRVEHIEREFLCLLFGEDLQAQLVLGIRAGFDRFPQIAAMEIGVGAGDLDGLVPDQRVRAGAGRPVELDEDATRPRR